MTDIATQMDETRAGLVDELTSDAQALRSGEASPADTAPKAERLIAEAERLRLAADEQRAEVSATAERDAARELAAQLVAEQTKRAIDAVGSAGEPAPTMTDSIRQAARDGRSLDLRLDISRAAAWHQAVSRGLTHRDVRTAQRVGDGGSEMRDLSVGTDTAGGHLVPDLLETMIYDGLRLIQGLRAAGAEVITSMGGGPLEIPRISTPFSVTGTLESAEGAEVADTDDAYDQLTLNAYKYTAQNKLSKELLADHGVNLEATIGRRIGEVIAEKIERRFTAGTGTSMPKGINHGVPAANNTSYAFTTGSTGPSWQHLTDAIGALDSRYIERGVVWMMPSPTYYGLVGVLDSDGQPLHQPRTAERPFDTILGHRISYNPYLPAWAASTRGVALVGDFSSAYVIREVGMFDLAMSSEVRFLQQQVVFQGTLRADGAVRDQLAYEQLSTGSA